MSRSAIVLFLMALLASRAEADAVAYDCQFDWLVNAAVEQESEEWTIELVDINHQMRIVIDETDSSRARIVTDVDAVPAEVVEREGMVQIVEQAGEAASAMTTIFVLREIDGAHPAVHTNQHTFATGFGASQIHGSCRPQA